MTANLATIPSDRSARRRATATGPAVLAAVLALAILRTGVADAQSAEAFTLAPAVAVEAEDFRIERGWKVVRNGEGNYMVDLVGFNHISGERLLSADRRDTTASAYADVQIPEPGNYRLWVRYEYPPFTDARFRVVVEQDGQARAEKAMGAADSPRYAFDETAPRPQYDPPWGPEGLALEAVDVPGLKAGRARIRLLAEEQPQVPGRTADRNIDLVYLTADTSDAWMAHYRKQVRLYPILETFRDTRGPRYEYRVTNRGDAPLGIRVRHTYNRIPWYGSEPAAPAGIEPGGSSRWTPLLKQDTCHNYAVTFSSGGPPFDMEIRPTGGAVEARGAGEAAYSFFLPPYPGKGEQARSTMDALEAVLAYLKAAPTIGRRPTEPLCYGGWLPWNDDSAYARRYCDLYAALGMRSLHQTHGGPRAIENLKRAGIEPTRTWMRMTYRNPPLPKQIEEARAVMETSGMGPYLLWYDYGDEIHFSEWLQLLLNTRTADSGPSADEVLAEIWRQWLGRHRSGYNPADYWRGAWGAVDAGRLRPDSSAAAAREAPKLYVDSVIFYEDAAIDFVAQGARQVKRALGDHVLCGANYSAHPFYLPTTAMYVKWFRRGAADKAQHSEYFWQVAQAGPMINGYVAEHFRCGMRGNPRAVLRQYNMPHSPGNQDGSFLRSAFTHLAHGAKCLDFFGMAMNDQFTENNIDHRDHARFDAIRQVTHAVGLVDDLVWDSQPVPSQAALLVSESTERWDLAGIARDRSGHDLFGPDFRQTRLHYHLERLGLWTAMTFLGESPDLLIEEDLSPRVLRDYRMLVVVGDHLPAEAAKPVEQWVAAGGLLLATAGAGLHDPYGAPNEAWPDLLGLAERTTRHEATFLRPRQELPFLEPTGVLVGEGWYTVRLATRETIRPAEGVETLARFSGEQGAPAVIARPLGKGRVVYAAALPGVAYVWAALQPPAVPDRGPAAHEVPDGYDPGVRTLLTQLLDNAGVHPRIVANPPQLDTRLIQSPNGYYLPVANYQRRIGGPASLRVRVDRPIRQVTSAYHGKLASSHDDGWLSIDLPALGYGDVLRLEP